MVLKASLKVTNTPPCLPSFREHQPSPTNPHRNGIELGNTQANACASVQDPQVTPLLTLQKFLEANYGLDLQQAVFTEGRRITNRIDIQHCVITE
jgi:hypothetical protein